MCDYNESHGHFTFNHPVLKLKKMTPQIVCNKTSLTNTDHLSVCSSCFIFVIDAAFAKQVRQRECSVCWHFPLCIIVPGNDTETNMQIPCVFVSACACVCVCVCVLEMILKLV